MLRSKVGFIRDGLELEDFVEKPVLRVPVDLSNRLNKAVGQRRVKRAGLGSIILGDLERLNRLLIRYLRSLNHVLDNRKVAELAHINVAKIDIRIEGS